MASEDNQAPADIVQHRKRGPGRCVICGETWADRYVGAEVCGKQKCYYQRSVAKGRAQASDSKEK